MQQPSRARDLLGYAGSPPHPHWPGGVRVAVSIVVNFEEGAEFSVTDGDTENEAVYEIEQPVLGNPIRRLTAISNMVRAPGGGASWKCWSSTRRR